MRDQHTQSRAPRDRELEQRVAMHVMMTPWVWAMASASAWLNAPPPPARPRPAPAPRT
jgi:hypothetical protein